MKHRIIQDSEIITVEHEHVSDYGEKIPRIVAVTHSGFPPEDWDKVIGKRKAIFTREEYIASMDAISIYRRKNSLMMS